MMSDIIQLLAFDHFRGAKHHCHWQTCLLFLQGMGIRKLKFALELVVSGGSSSLYSGFQNNKISITLTSGDPIIGLAILLAS